MTAIRDVLMSGKGTPFLDKGRRANIAGQGQWTNQSPRARGPLQRGPGHRRRNQGDRATAEGDLLGKSRAVLPPIRGLPAEVRTKVFEQALPSMLDFWDPLEEVMVPRLVLMAAGSPKRIPEVIALLEKGGSSALALAEAVTSPNPKVDAARELDRDALRKRRGGFLDTGR